MIKRALLIISGRRGGYRIPAEEIDNYISQRYNEKKAVS